MVQIDQEIVRPGEAVLEEPSSCTWYQRYGKRGLDLTMGVALFLLTVPLVLVLAVLVALTSGWPPFYVATRIGKDGKPFRLWKLRTMADGADRAPVPKLADLVNVEETRVTGHTPRSGPRVTLLGRFLRKTRLDGLPSVWILIRYDRHVRGSWLP